MVVAGLPTARSDHAEALAHYALDLRKAVKRERFAGEPLNSELEFTRDQSSLAS